jgi:hypothetical protein
LEARKRHHYIPQFYQEYFCKDEGYLWLYDRENGEYRYQQPLNTAVIGHYYEKNEIEDYLSKVEGLTKPTFEKLFIKEQLELEEKKMLTYFISLMRVRVPRFEKVINMQKREYLMSILDESLSSVQSAKKMIDDYEKDTGEITNIDPNFLVKAKEDGHITVPDSRETSLQVMFPAAEKISKAIFNKTWYVLFAPKGSSFITSDNPFVVVNPPEMEENHMENDKLFQDNSTIFFPLSHKVCLAIEGNSSTIIFITIHNKAVKEINFVSAINSECYIISRDKPLLQSIVIKAGVQSSRNY